MTTTPTGWRVIPTPPSAPTRYECIALHNGQPCSTAGHTEQEAIERMRARLSVRSDGRPAHVTRPPLKGQARLHAIIALTLPGVARLKSGERRALEMLAEGQTYADIAREFGLARSGSYITVKRALAVVSDPSLRRTTRARKVPK